MAWWVIALLIWFAASVAAAGVVVLLSRRGRAARRPASPAERRGPRRGGRGRGRSLATGGLGTGGPADRRARTTPTSYRHRRR